MSNTYLSLPVHSYNTVRRLMYSSGENGLTTDTVHVNTCPTLQIVEMDVAKLCDHIRNAKLFAYLIWHG